MKTSEEKKIQHYKLDNLEYILDYSSNGVFLTVEFNAPDKKESTRDKLIENLDKKLDGLNREQIENMKLSEIRGVLIAPSQPEFADGDVKAIVSDDGNELMIVVMRPSGKGEDAKIEDAFRAIKAAGAEEFYIYKKIINDLFEDIRYDDFIKVGERRDGRVNLTISPDRLSALISLSPPCGGKPLTFSDVVDFLVENNIKSEFINEFEIKELIEAKDYKKTVCVATGIPPRDGKDGMIELIFESESEAPTPRLDERGRADYRSLGLISTVREKEFMARIIPPAKGKDGISVRGEPMPSKEGVPVSNPCGNNTSVSASNPSMIIADCDGRPKVEDGKVSVCPVLDIDGDVDFSTGHIEFNGCVNIKGDVLHGFSVAASGDINVYGLVDAANIEAGGDLYVKHGVAGQNKAIIRVKGAMFAKYIHNASVRVNGNLVVEELILHSTVDVDNEIHLGGGSNVMGGRIIGGMARAGVSIRANSIGNKLETPTRIILGKPLRIQADTESTKSEVKRFVDELDGMLKSLKSAGPDERNERKPERDSAGGSVKETAVAVETGKGSDDTSRRKTISGVNPKIFAGGKVFPGVSVSIRHADMKISDEIETVEIFEKDGEILVRELKGEKVHA